RSSDLGRPAWRGRAGAAHGVLGADEQGGRAFLPPRFPAAWKEPPGTLRKPFAARDSSAPACGRAMGPVACGMRFAACGMKHAAFGLRPVASGIRYVACGAGVDKDWRRWAVDTLLAAIDGGGSSTRVWVLSATGELLAEGRSGPSTVTVVGAEAAGRAVAEAARAAGLSAGDWPGGGANVAVVA